MAKAKFVVRKGTTGKFRFNLIGTNGKIIATSEPYNSKASALKGIEAVKRHALEADVLEPDPSASGHVRLEPVADGPESVETELALEPAGRGFVAARPGPPVGVRPRQLLRQRERRRAVERRRQ